MTFRDARLDPKITAFPCLVILFVQLPCHQSFFGSAKPPSDLHPIRRAQSNHSAVQITLNSGIRSFPGNRCVYDCFKNQLKTGSSCVRG